MGETEKNLVVKPDRADRQVGTYINMEDAEKMIAYAKWAVEKHVAPKGMIVEQYFMCLQAGLDLQMNLMQVNSSLCIINGRVSIYGPEVIARAKRAGYIVTPLEESKTMAKVQIETAGRTPYVAEFTKEDADTAGLTEGDRAAVWKKYPKDLLFWKAAARAIRKYAPEVLGGYEVAEDVLELKKPEPAKTITRPNLAELQTKEELKLHGTGNLTPEYLWIDEQPGEVSTLWTPWMDLNMATWKASWPTPAPERYHIPMVDDVVEWKIEWEQAELPS